MCTGTTWRLVGIYCAPGCKRCGTTDIANTPLSLQEANLRSQAFRYCYFFAAWPVLWLVLAYVNEKLFNFIEWWWYRCVAESGWLAGWAGGP